MPLVGSIPSCPGVPGGRRPAGVTARTYRVELITPMFGGGVKAGEPDEKMPVRGTTIRGQLEFWWRATVGAACRSPEELRSKQEKVWGSTERASRVGIALRVKGLEAEPCASYVWSPQARRGQGGWKLQWRPWANPVKYALFPFQGSAPPPRRNAKSADPPRKCIRTLSFELTVEAPDKLWEELRSALQAWALFGGLGARTRRGCGAIRVTGLNEGTFVPKDRSALEQAIKDCCRPRSVRPWPTLAKAVLRGPEFGSATDAWGRAIQLLEKFRQRPDVGRNPGQRGRPGRSRWPEPETIRGLTGRRDRNHHRLDYMPTDATPRAELGLPIVFHFKDRRDPPDVFLQPTDHERMASPLILRPVALANGKYVPIVCVLNTEPLSGVEFVEVEHRRPLRPRAPLRVRGADLCEYRNSPLRYDRTKSGSAVEAFLGYAERNGFQRIV